MPASDYTSLSTPRLRLIPVSEADPEEVAHGIGNYDVVRWLGQVPYPYRASDARAFIDECRGKEGRVWFICDQGGLVGGIGVDGEFGYWIARPAWGRGYATEAGEAAIDAFFGAGKASELRSSYYADNDRSGAVLVKLGFRPDGISQVRARALGQMVDRHDMLLSREGWRARRTIGLRTPRLVLRPLTAADAPRLARIGGVEEVARMMCSIPSPFPEAAARDWIARGQFRGRPGYRLGIALPRGGLIGAAGLGQDLSLSIMLDRRYHGRGYGREALAHFIADAFARFPAASDLLAERFADNPASGHLLARLGFEVTGQGLAGTPTRAERAPVIRYRLRRAGFTAPQPA